MSIAEIKSNIDVVSGSLHIEECDYKLADVKTPFYLRRHYSSVADNHAGMLGDKWVFEIESRVNVSSGQCLVRLPDLSEEKFRLEGHQWKNLRVGDESSELTYESDGFRYRNKRDELNLYYDAQGKLKHIIDCWNNQTELIYKDGKVSKVLLTSGLSIEFKYNGNVLSSVTDSYGRCVHYLVNDNKLAMATFPTGISNTYTYTKEGYLTGGESKANKQKLRYEFDRKGRVVHFSESEGENFSVFYDLASKTNIFCNEESNEKTAYTYEVNQCVSRILFPDGTSEMFKYDAGRNIVFKCDRGGEENFYEYNSAGMKTQERGLSFDNSFEQREVITRYSYDDSLNCICVSDNIGREIQNIYDKRGYLVQQKVRIDANSFRTTDFTYDNKGRILSEKNALGEEWKYEYDTMFQTPSKAISPSGICKHFKTDALGRVTEYSDSVGKILYSYSIDDIVVETRDEAGELLLTPNTEMPKVKNRMICKAMEPKSRYIYNAAGNIIEARTPWGDEYELSVYKYDTAGRCTQEKHFLTPQTIDSESGKVHVIQYFYDCDGRVVRLEDSAGIHKEYEYDDRSNVIKLKMSYEDGNIQETRIGYSSFGDMVRCKSK